MAVQVERTSDAIVLKLLLDTNAKDIQRVLNYFEYLDLVGKSKATAAQIDALAKAAKSGGGIGTKRVLRELKHLKT